MLMFYLYHVNVCSLQLVFGPNATIGDEKCWEENTKGYWRGNCGYDINDTTGKVDTYHKCAEK